MQNKIEIMSPVGSWEALSAAMQAGAGSVYFGVGELNMRSKSTFNFTLDDLRTIASTCNEKGVKSYLTLNTVIYDGDMEYMKQTADAAKESGITAVIASDLAVMDYCRRIGLEVHISTQANVSNLEAVRFFAQYGDVIVLARELSLEQIKYITYEIEKQDICGPLGEKIKIEIFVHGAMCMAISGKCYMSLHEKNHSANRGKCLQICRRSYTATDNETGRQLEFDNQYIMSPKDMCTIGFIDKIIEAGACVLKIEGRGRSPEYVKIATECYRKAVDAYYSGEYNDKLIAQLNARLDSVYNRGFWDGYYLGKEMIELTDRYGSSATKKKAYVGKIMNYYAKVNAAEMLVESESVRTGDEIMIIGPTTGVVELVMPEMRKDENNILTEAHKGDSIAFYSPEIARKSDKVYKLISRKI